ncbi:NACHT domain-containing protein [Marinifilum flexuosum]|uniref:NACHT domain-containing protein n=1 Tax=Marinifilum flexuosum TaxID=1117708 RepID=UPI00249003EA|nr:NACHT domain-containing protein [Marinifilum flexuosum]
MLVTETPTIRYFAEAEVKTNGCEIRTLIRKEFLNHKNKENYSTASRIKNHVNHTLLKYIQAIWKDSIINWQKQMEEVLASENLQTTFCAKDCLSILSDYSSLNTNEQKHQFLIAQNQELKSIIDENTNAWKEKGKQDDLLRLQEELQEFIQEKILLDAINTLKGCRMITDQFLKEIKNLSDKEILKSFDLDADDFKQANSLITGNCTTEFRDYTINFAVGLLMLDLQKEYAIIEERKKEGISLLQSKKRWNDYLEESKNQTYGFLAEMSKEKYDAEVFTDRNQVSKSFDQFIESTSNAFVLLGNAGSGKTNQICHWASELLKKEECIICINSKIFSNIGVEEYFQTAFGELKLETLLTNLQILAQQQGKKIYLFFDAINECVDYFDKTSLKNQKGPIELLTVIDKYFIKHNLPDLKIVISCRSYTWKELIELEASSIKHDLYYSNQRKEEHTTIQHLSESELKCTYQKYQQKYQLKTSSEELFHSDFNLIRNRLTDPLILKMSSLVFQKQALPKDIRLFHSNHLFENLLKEKGITPTGKNKREYVLLNKIAKYLWKSDGDSIHVEQLISAYDDEDYPLHKLSKSIFYNDDFEFSLPFEALIEKGILKIEEKNSINEIRFVYERYQEYLFARIFKEQENIKLVHPALPIPPEAYKTALHSGKNYAVVRNALRSALLQDYLDKNNDPKTILSLAYDNNYEVQQLVIDALSVILQEDYHQLWSLLEQMLSHNSDDSNEKGKRLDKLEKLLEDYSKKKTNSQSTRYEQRLQERNQILNDLSTTIQVKKIAIYAIYEIFKSDIYQNQLYPEDKHPVSSLLHAMANPVSRVRDIVSLYVYYISKLDKNLGFDILDHLAGKMTKSNVIFNFWNDSLKKHVFEPAIRISTLLIVEDLSNKKKVDLSKDYEFTFKIIKQWIKILTEFSIVFPVLKKFTLRKLATVQSEYVNNGIEYQHFWDKIPIAGKNGEWSQQGYNQLLDYLTNDKEDFKDLHPLVMKAMYSGDAYSFFMLERVLIMQAFQDWKRIENIVQQVNEADVSHPCVDYMQMSTLYVLFRYLIAIENPDQEAMRLFSTLTYNWTARCKGVYFAHNNYEANNNKPYKQYTLNWYGAAYCVHYGDGNKCDGDEYPMPIFYQLIDEAMQKMDKELLYCCIENIAVLVTDFGYHKSALQLFEYTMNKIQHESTIIDLDAIQVNRANYQDDIRTFLCKTLGTIKSYHHKEVDFFIYNNLRNSSFPDIDKFREELINYNQSYENIGDLLTHKFGNFIIWSLQNDPKISASFKQIMQYGTEVENYKGWFKKLSTHVFDKLFGIEF